MYFSKEKYEISVRWKPEYSQEGAARISWFVMTLCHNRSRTSSTPQVLLVCRKYSLIITQVILSAQSVSGESNKNPQVGG